VVEALPDGPQARAFVAMAGQVAGAVSVQVMKSPRLPVIGAQPRA
jgi:ATP-binding protein involved in chromosome partitioning